MKTSAIVFTVSALAACALSAADPYVGYIYPSGMQAGTTNRLVIGGQNLNRVRGLRFSGEGLSVLKIENVPGFPNPTGPQKKHLTKWLDGIAEGNLEEPPLPEDPHVDEWRSNAWWRVLGTLDAGQLAIVESDLFTPKNPLQATPSLRQKMLVTVVADASAKPVRGELSLYGPSGISAPRPFEITSAAHVAEPLYAPPHRPAPELPPVDVPAGGEVVLDGQIMPGSTDAFRLRLEKGRRYSFKATARELQPYVGDAVPGFFNASITLKDEKGEVVAFADDEMRFRPDPVMEFAPEADGVYRLEIHDVLYRGREDFVYSVAVAEGHAPKGVVPESDGIVGPGEVVRKEIDIDRPGRMVLEVWARRLGSPLDAVMTLRRAPDGPALAHWDDVTNTVFIGTIPQTECDPRGEFDFKEAGRYIVEITDRTGHGGPDYFWRLDVRRPKPGFAVYSARSTLPLSRNNPLKVVFHVVRCDGFNGDVKLEFPNEVRGAGGVITSGVDVVTAQLYSKGPAIQAPRPATIFATAEIGGSVVRVPVMPCDEYEQAFAWKHLVPAETFILTSQGGGPAKKPAGKPAGKQAGKQAGKPAAKPAEKPATKPEDKPASSMDKSGEAGIEKDSAPKKAQ